MKQLLTAVVGIVTIGTLIAFISLVTFLTPLGSENSALPYRTVNEDLPADVDAALQRVEEASRAAYGGLDTTKELIGKTEARKIAIEQGRSEAERKLGDLANRVRTAVDRGEPISKTDRKVLINLQASSL